MGVGEGDVWGKDGLVSQNKILYIFSVVHSLITAGNDSDTVRLLVIFPASRLCTNALVKTMHFWGFLLEYRM